MNEHPPWEIGAVNAEVFEKGSSRVDPKRAHEAVDDQAQETYIPDTCFQCRAQELASQAAQEVMDHD